MSDTVNHPRHYGGEDNPYEAIKVIEAWGLGFCLGNVIKYISRAGRKNSAVQEDLMKARWYLDREIARLDLEAFNAPQRPKVTTTVSRTVGYGTAVGGGGAGGAVGHGGANSMGGGAGS